MMYIRKINKAELPKVEQLYFKLSADDRYTRFMHTMSDDSLRKYVASLESPDHILVGVFDFNEKLHGIAEGCISGSTITGAFVVLDSSRKCGLGKALVDRVLMEGRLAGCSQFEISCFSNNVPMVKLARKLNMEMHSEFGEMEAFVDLAEATVSDRLDHLNTEMLEQAGYTLVELTRLFWSGGSKNTA